MTNETKQNLLKLAVEVAKAVLSAILAFLGVVSLQSCGVTKAYISNPQNGATTQITITTNNPITTEVSPDVKLKNSK